MALNFPDSPTNGDVVILSGNTYTYNSATTTWDKANPGAAVNISDVSPTNPVVGDTWFSSTDGAYYVYYNDGTSSQWVATSGPAGPAGSSVNLSAYAGDILPDVDSSRSLGSPTKKWKSLYLSSNTLFLGDSGSISAGAGGEITMPSMKIGSGANTIKLGVSATGEFETRKVTGGVVKAAKPSGTNAVQTFSDLAALTDNDPGNTVLVKDTKKVYMFDGTGWYLVATMVNDPPGAITDSSMSTSYSLNTDGNPLVIHANAIDPEGFPLTWSFTTSGLVDEATVVQGTGDSTNKVTITPSTVEANAGTFSLIANVTDGVNASVTKTAIMDLSFSANFDNITGGTLFTADNGKKYYYSNHTVQTHTGVHMQFDVIPGTQFYIGMIGASGGAGPTVRGSNGGYGNALVTVPTGVTTMTAYLGGGGQAKWGPSNSEATLNGGLSRGGDNSTDQGYWAYGVSAAGGGLVGLFKGAYTATPSQSDAILIAGSGGGGGAWASNQTGGSGAQGGWGGKPGSSGGGHGASGTGTALRHGGAGTLTAGGLLNNDGGGHLTTSAASGSALTGGRGEGSKYDGGGGGGAGYFGGGGGQGGGGWSGGHGGGGSGYISSDATVNSATYEGNGLYATTRVPSLGTWAMSVGGGTDLSLTGDYGVAYGQNNDGADAGQTINSGVFAGFTQSSVTAGTHNGGGGSSFVVMFDA
jgi:hypothetical protein